MPQVSIIVPAFNSGATLGAAIRSALAQTVSTWEMVIVDDGSTEDLSWVKSIDVRVRILRQANAGPSIARNRGMAETTGHYIAFLDADDVWMPDKLQKQIELMESRPNVGLCHTRFDQIDANGCVTGKGFGCHADSYADLLRGSRILTSTVMMRRECVKIAGWFDPRLRGPEDFEYFLRVAREFRTAFINETLVQYRCLDGSLSKDFGRMYKQSAWVFRRHAAMARRDGCREAVKSAREGLRNLRVSHGCIRFDRSRQNLRQRRFCSALRDLSSAAWLYPEYTIVAAGRYLLGRLGFGARAERVSIDATERDLG